MTRARRRPLPPPTQHPATVPSPSRCTILQNGTQLLFLGDSITEVWRGTVCGIPCHPALQLQCDACVRGRSWQGTGGGATNALALATSLCSLNKQVTHPLFLQVLRADAALLRAV